MKRFTSRKQEKENSQTREEIVINTATEIGKLIHSGNYQGENFNRVVDYIQNIIIGTLESDVKLLGLKHKIYVKNVGLALIMPGFIGEEYLENQINKHDPEFIDMYQKNQVTRVSTDSLRRHFILKALDEILKISSVEEFGDKNYKIGDIEINTFEDLEQHRTELQDMRDKWKNYKIPGFKEAVQYAAQKGISTNFYS